MLRSTKLALTSCAIAFSAIPAAFAADLPIYSPPPATPAVIPPPPVAASGWYLRGDIGYKIYQNPDVRYDGAVIGAVNFSHEKIDNTGTIGGGVGYKFNDWLRADVTVDYEWPGKFHGNTPCGACGSGLNDEYADISAVTGLANVYADLGYYAGFAPYIGAGVGLSYLRTSDVHSINADGTRVDFDSDGRTNFAWALMAGVSYDITHNVALDVGYRYLNLGDAVAKDPDYDGRIKYKDIAAHEIRVGLRYTFGDGPKAF
ncbi:Opacity protein [Faunimonas pinastri]|uniref:Opacity protein n=1 Tax=Faunimonas pinastri TaxID=1855383 RepID=A0A1H8ZAH4_9HYPH|nr:outer membrane protein [Faunimonas pinastri]SEP60608.1 Opacity protein [Faunimonas pinastri]